MALDLQNQHLKEITLNARPKVTYFVVMKVSTHEEPIKPILKIGRKDFKVAVIFLTRYNGLYIILPSIIFLQEPQLSVILI